MSTYEIVQRFVAGFGLIYFGLMFLIALVYALWPSKGQAYEEAARIPLHED
jgi:cytochrome c oxidase cbb3-type subunit 4